tara:strand:- start:1209 stop:1496 length:288 start_codon:yes stop_codon:yes gene_type:complete
MTIYRQSANPNATNSELDAKIIIKNRPLTSPQRDELIQQYVELITDSMDVKTLEQFVRDTLIDDYDKLSEIELKDEIRYTFDEETLTELIDNVDS